MRWLLGVNATLTRSLLLPSLRKVMPAAQPLTAYVRTIVPDVNARRAPSGENATPYWVKPVSTVVDGVRLRPSKLQILTRPSSPAVATIWPFGEIATDLILTFGQPLVVPWL